MDRPPEPEPSDPTLRVTRDVYYVLVHTLRGALLPPVNDTPEELARRDNAAIGQVAAMLPANADEAYLAAQCVAARLYGMDCVRQARDFGATDQMWAHKCAAQAASMWRESRQARSLLMRLQAAREKREADSAATDRAAWSEHCTIGLMKDALAGAPPAAPAEPPTVPPVPEPSVAEPPQRDMAAEAELYAVLYPRRARLIRSLGGLPDNPDFGPTDPELVPFIVSGTTPHLRALDAEALEEAAD
jgi:hypothetical protein